MNVSLHVSFFLSFIECIREIVSNVRCFARGFSLVQVIVESETKLARDSEEGGLTKKKGKKMPDLAL